MRNKIQKSMMLVLGIALALSFVLMTVLLYTQTLEDMKSEVQQEARYIETALNMTDSGYLKELEGMAGSNRLTLISPDGDVIYDSVESTGQLSNHSERAEIQQAIKTGKGESLRLSDTFRQQTYYYAYLLENGNVLRISQTTETVLSTLVNLLPMALLISGVMIFFVYLLCRWQTERLIRPINEIDLEHPLDNDIYEELTPLLRSMEHQNKEKEKIEQMRKEFSANVSHELKTPLTSISGYAELLKSGLVRPDDIGTFASRIYDEASRMIVLIDDIIKLSRLDEESIELEKQDVDFMAISREVISRLALKAEKYQVKMEVSGEPAVYRGIRQILQEMIYNLCENAVKYNKRGGSVTVWVGRMPEGIKVIVTDTGIGIPEDSLDRIFERFYRVDKSHSKEIGGTGLGLSIVKHGAILHNAEVHVKSTLDVGTRIELLFK